MWVGSFFGYQNGRLMIGYTIAGKDLPNKVLARQEAELVRSPFQTELHDYHAWGARSGG